VLDEILGLGLFVHNVLTMGERLLCRLGVVLGTHTILRGQLYLLTSSCCIWRAVYGVFRGSVSSVGFG